MAIAIALVVLGCCYLTLTGVRRHSFSPRTAILRNRAFPSLLGAGDSSRLRKRERSVLDEPRIALLIPYAGRDRTSVVPYLSLFCRGAAGAADVADFFLIHNGVLAGWPRLLDDCPPNVIFVNLESNRALALRLLRVLQHPFHGGNITATRLTAERGDRVIHTGESERSSTIPVSSSVIDEELVELIASFIKIHPYGLVEFKPALGHIFHDLIRGYSHWGYTDLDIIFGDLSRWITPDELQKYDIVTYTYGDQYRLYLRGQFTFHRNDPERINQLWRQCDYLTQVDDRFRKIQRQEIHYHTESAEGCYSAVILNQTNLRVKYAAMKAWTDTPEGLGADHDTIPTHGVYLATSPRTNRQVLYKAKLAGDNALQVAKLGSKWWEDGTDIETILYRRRDQPLEKPVGAMEQLERSENPEKNNCMYWVLPKYQSNICLDATVVTSQDNVYWIDGALYKQRREILDHGVAATAPLFHFQEWKRKFRYGQLAALQSDWASTVLLTKAGIIPKSGRQSNIAKKSAIHSPLGLKMRNWNALDNGDLSQLPGNLYCVVSKFDSVSKKSTRCVAAVVWRDGNITSIQSAAPGWNQVNVETDVTLVLTLQIPTKTSRDAESLKAALRHLTDNIENWVGQPSVTVLFLEGATEDSVKVVTDIIGPESNFARRNENALVATIYDDLDDVQISRKALLNMAIDAVPTRWYVTGIELERGLSLSSYASFWASRTAAKYKYLRGHFFWIPQFAIREVENAASHELLTDFRHLAKAKLENRIQSPFELEESCEIEFALAKDNLFATLNDLWWSATDHLYRPLDRQDVDSFVRTHTESLQTFETGILDGLSKITKSLTSVMHLHQDESPILLVDNLAISEGARVSDLAREVEEMNGRACFNGLKVAQLVLMGHQIGVLPGVYAVSTEASRRASEVTKTTGNKYCRGCAETSEELLKIYHQFIAIEIQRSLQTSVVTIEDAK